jgi:two-component system sensor kinase FixL
LSFRDVTARVIAEQDARHRREEMQALLRFRTIAELGSAIAHELNQPVAAIRNYAAGCLKMIPNDDLGVIVGWAIRKIEQEADRAARIMRSIRNFTTEGRTERRIQPIRDLCADVEALTSVRARENGATISFSVQPRTLRALCDRSLTEQVLVNLILNALQAIQGDGSHDRNIEVTAHVLDPDFVEIVVKDRGRGMKPEQLEALFQARRSTRESFGLGLILSRSIVTNHGGQMWVRSVVGEGTAMFFTLRRRQEKSRSRRPTAIRGHG